MICFFNWGKVKEAAEEPSPLRPDDLILEMFPARSALDSWSGSHLPRRSSGFWMPCVHRMPFFFLPVILTPPRLPSLAFNPFRVMLASALLEGGRS